MSIGLYWNRDELRPDRFYNFISCTDVSFTVRRGIAAHTLAHPPSNSHITSDDKPTELNL